MLPFDWRELVGIQVVGICLLVLVWTSSLSGKVIGSVGG